ncbi:MAG TPA: PIN domain-containing protein [Thermoanaerobaculia bacterium]|nr:PIN domain-containing protein [Thermoanaerobaculia bacterium]
MIARVFLDTDVILDLLLGREPFFAAAADLMVAVQDGRIEGCVSPLVFSNLFYILRQQMSAPEAVSTLRKLKLLVRVLAVDEQVIELALASSFKDFEDAIQYYTAVAHDLSAVVTRNKRDYREAELPVLDARECVELFAGGGKRPRPALSGPGVR